MSIKIKYKKKGNLVGPKEIAEIFGVHRNTALNWAKTGKVPAIIVGKTYRYSIEEVASATNLPEFYFN